MVKKILVYINLNNVFNVKWNKMESFKNNSLFLGLYKVVFYEEYKFWNYFMDDYMVYFEWWR